MTPDLWYRRRWFVCGLGGIAVFLMANLPLMILDWGWPSAPVGLVVWVYRMSWLALLPSTTIAKLLTTHSAHGPNITQTILHLILAHAAYFALGAAFGAIMDWNMSGSRGENSRS